MPQSCTICRHPERTTIDGALVESEPLRNIAERFGTTATSLHRHRQHLPAYLALAQDAKQRAHASGLLDRVEFLIDRLEGIAQNAEEERAWSAAVTAIREIRGCLVLLAQLNGELQRAQETNITVNVSLQRVQAKLIAASPNDFAQFCKKLLEEASKEQQQAALAVLPKDRGFQQDLSVLTDEELDMLDRLSKKVHAAQP